MRLADALRRRGRWTVRTATSEEVRALRHVLQGDDPRFGQLIEQLRTTPEVRRDRPASDRFRVSPTSTTEDLTFVLEVGRVHSAWVPVRETTSGRMLELRATVVRSGFLEVLEGRTVDGGPWPDAWDPMPPEEPPAGGPALVLPSLEEIEAAQRQARADLRDWLGVDLRDDLTLYPPVPEPVIRDRESDLGARFTTGFRQFLMITDGVESRDIRVLGHEDAYLIDDPHFDGVIIAWDGDEKDDFVATQDLDGRSETVRRIDVHERGGTLREAAPDMAAYLRDRLAR